MGSPEVPHEERLLLLQMALMILDWYLRHGGLS